MSARFDELMQAAEAAFTEDDFEGSAAALRRGGRGRTRAAATPTAPTAPSATTARCLVELDRGADQIPKLKEILLRSSNTRNRFHAAYCTAVAYDISGESDKAQGYADRAASLADELGDPVSASRSLNLVGNLSIRILEVPDEAETLRPLAGGPPGPRRASPHDRGPGSATTSAT